MAMTKFYDGVQRSEQALESGFEIAAKLREKLSLTSIQKVNAAYLEGLRETGDPEANAYLNQMYTLGMEYGRLVMGAASIAMLPVSGAEAAQKRFTAALSEGQFDAERQQVKAEAETWRTAAQNVMKDRLASLRSFGKTGSAPAAPVAAPVAAPALAPAAAPAAAPVPPARAPAAVGPVNAAEQEESLANLRAALKKYPERRDDILAYARMTGVSIPGDL
jgi:DNA-directed RNA polymerase specialized sigma24 family protein